MTESGLQALLKKGEELFGLLEQETADCLKSLETITTGELEQFLEKRQKLVSELIDFDSKLSAYQSDSSCPVPLSDLADKKEFTHCVSRVLQRILRMDGLLRALAERKMILLRDEIDSLSRGLKALHGYQRGNTVSSSRDFIA